MIGPRSHCEALAAGVLVALQLDLKDALADRERRIKRYFCRSCENIRGAIDPRHIVQQPFVLDALAELPEFDGTERVVAGVIGSVFQLAGHDEKTVAVGCRIGHALGRLMSLSDAVDDYSDDLAKNKPNLLRTAGVQPDIDAADMELEELLLRLEKLVAGLPLRRNEALLTNIIAVHARARKQASVAKFNKQRKDTP